MVSVRAKLATSAVALARILSSLGLLLVLVTVSHLVFLGEGGAPPEPSPTQWWLVIGGGSVAAAFAVAEKALGGLSARSEERRLRGRLLEEVFKRGPEGFASASEDDSGVDQAVAVNMMTDGVERFTEYRQAYLGSTVAALVTPLLVLAYISIWVDWVTGLILLGLFFLAPLLIGGFMSAFRKTSSASRKERERLSGGYLDTLRNLEMISLMGAGRRVQAQLAEKGERNRLAIMRLLARNQIVIIVTDGLFSLLLICAAAATVLWRSSGGAVTPVEALSVMLLTALLIEPLSQVAGFFYIGMGGLAAGRRIKNYLARSQPETVSVVHARADEGGRPIPALAASDAHFDYGRGEVLRGISMTVDPGEKVALVGASGEGKSTLLKLFRGVATPNSGSVAVRGVDLAHLPAEQRRRQVATVNQTTWLFTGTVADNLRLAKPDATEHEMRDALRRANLIATVEGMPHGLDSDVGERGALLSGGEAQRLALARAFLSGRRILVMDEPTSQVDARSEELIAQSLARLGSEWTVLVATHRPRLLEDTDETWRMAGGRLVGVSSE